MKLKEYLCKVTADAAEEYMQMRILAHTDPAVKAAFLGGKKQKGGRQSGDPNP